MAISRKYEVCCDLLLEARELGMHDDGLRDDHLTQSCGQGWRCRRCGNGYGVELIQPDSDIN